MIDSSQNGAIKQYSTAEFEDPYGVIDRYLGDVEIEPAKICVGIAAVRNSVDGSVRLVKRGWPVFKPQEATLRYGVDVVTANDMITTAVGVFEQPSDVTVLKEGTDEQSHLSPTLVYAWSTGIGAAVVIPSESTMNESEVEHQHPTYLQSVCGHSGFAPQREEEIDYLRFVSSQHLGKLSIEFALGGEDGMRNLIEYQVRQSIRGMSDLYAAVKDGEKDKIAAGKILLDAAVSEGGI